MKICGFAKKYRIQSGYWELLEMLLSIHVWACCWWKATAGRLAATEMGRDPRAGQPCWWTTDTWAYMTDLTDYLWQSVRRVDLIGLCLFCVRDAYVLGACMVWLGNNTMQLAIIYIRTKLKHHLFIQLKNSCLNKIYKPSNTSIVAYILFQKNKASTISYCLNGF